MNINIFWQATPFWKFNNEKFVGDTIFKTSPKFTGDNLESLVVFKKHAQRSIYEILRSQVTCSDLLRCDFYRSCDPIGS